jgi:CheY-like chemotaxis protein
MKILLVDDSRTNKESLMTFFETLGHDVVGANDGKEAISTIKTNNDIELIITDFHMPYYNGDEVIKVAKRANANLPCVLISAFSDEAKSSFEKRLKMCKSCYIYQKPIDIREIAKDLSQIGVDIWNMK